jgi:hypothetical protein
MGVAKTNSFPLPINVNSGLLDHSVHCPANSEFDPEEYTEPFWSTDDDRPATYQWFPLGFSPRRLQIYFQNQFDRFCEQFTRECPEVASLDRLQDRYLFEHEAALRLYEKPWYEFHALQYLDWVKMSTDDASKHPVFTSILTHDFGGQLGRLVEQYYWRFRFEEEPSPALVLGRARVQEVEQKPKRMSLRTPHGRMRLQKSGQLDRI